MNPSNFSPLTNVRPEAKPSIFGQCVGVKVPVCARVLRIGTLMSRTLAGLLLMALALALPATRASAAVDPAPFSLREPPFNPQIAGLLGDAQKAMRNGKLKEALQILS